MCEMEEGVRSGRVVKKKSSSGCLIIKKKVDVLGSGVGSSCKEKKRARVLGNELGSSDESLQPIRRKFSDEMRNGPVVYSRRVEGDREFGRNGGIVEAERKRSRMDLFEFDEYDEFDGKRTRNDYLEMVERSGSLKEFGGRAGRNAMVEKGKHAYFDASSSGLSGRNKAIDYGGKSRFDFEDDEAHLPISLLRLKYQEESEKIRLQGKNGVLKVMVNKKKKMDLTSSKSYDAQVADNKKGSRSEGHVKEEGRALPPFYSDSKRAEKQIAFSEKENSSLKVQKQPLKNCNKARDSEKEKSELKLKTPFGKSNNVEDDESDGTDTSLALAPPSSEAGSSKKAVKRVGRKSLLAENVAKIKGGEKNVIPVVETVTPVKGREGKVKRGGSTEKQLLRERIREMLITSGWTIDYRPRRNRDYLDAVYINPTGTAYWSIIKAYDALQKQLQEEDDKPKLDGGSSSFTPLSEDLINKLTRQTRKKIEEEMKKKRRDNAMTKKSKKALPKEDSAEFSGSDQHEERLSSFIRQNGKAKKGRLQEVDRGSGDDLGVDSCGEQSEQDTGRKRSANNLDVVQERKSRKIGRCTLLVRSSDKGPNSVSDGYVPYTGKRTLLAWLIDSETVQLSEKVQYMNRRKTRVKLEGWITREGIHCGCCSKILTVSKFELHAGSKLRQPFQNISLEAGPSLLQCLIDAWNKQEESVRHDFFVVDVDGDDPDDDTCGICGDGGDLICCDSCPSTFHQSCLGIKMLPPGDWHCPNCTCIFCGNACGEVTEGDDGADSEPLTCNLCEKKYHKSCITEIAAVVATSNTVTFCGKKCQEVYDYLQKMLGVKNELESGFTWSLIQRTDLESEEAQHGFPQRVECNSKLAVALSVMDECFLPIVDRRSGINLIHNVLCNCGSNFSRLNYHSFYTVILERGDEIISAASIRIHGTKLAEMPFIGTRHIYRRQGMCRRLLSAIESFLCFLKVEKLIIPAISEHMHTWTVVFGFKRVDELNKKEMKSLNMLVFPGTDMLQKLLVKLEIPEGVDIIESKTNCPRSPATIEKSEDSSGKQDTNVQGDTESEHMINTIHKADGALPVLSASPVTSNDTTVTSALHATHESEIKFSEKENTCFEAQPVKELSESSSGLKGCSSLGAANDHLEMKNTDTSVYDADNAKVLSSDSVVDISGAAPRYVAEENPISVSTACDTDDKTKQNMEEDNPPVVEMQSDVHISSGSASDVVLAIEGDRGSLAGFSGSGAHHSTEGNAYIEHRGINSFEESSIQNATGIASDQTFKSPFAPCIQADITTRFYSDLNNPIAVGVEGESHASSTTLSDGKDSLNGKVDLLDAKRGTTAVSDLDDGNKDHVNNFCSETMTNFSEEVGAQKAETISRSMKPRSVSPLRCTNTESKSSNCSSSVQNVEGETVHSVASGLDSVAEAHSNGIQATFEETMKEMKGSCGEPDIDSSSLGTEKVDESQNSGVYAVSDGTGESSVIFIPYLNQQAALVAETASIGASETIQCDIVAQPKTGGGVDGMSKLDDLHKLSADNQHVEPALRPSVVALGENTAELTS